MLVRFLTNAGELAAWARGEGFEHLCPSAWHLSVVRIDERSPPGPLDSLPLTVESSLDRKLARMGGLIALMFQSAAVSERHDTLRLAGGCWDYTIYRPHVSFMVDDGRDLRSARPFHGPLRFGPEIIDRGW